MTFNPSDAGLASEWGHLRSAADLKIRKSADDESQIWEANVRALLEACQMVGTVFGVGFAIGLIAAATHAFGGLEFERVPAAEYKCFWPAYAPQSIPYVKLNYGVRK